MTESGRYPVLTTTRLGRPRRVLPRFHRYYATEDLPSPPPLSVLILAVNGQIAKAQIERHGIRAAADAPARAMVVSEARHSLECCVDIDSAHPAERFAIHARFDCWVNDPLALIRHGCLDAEQQLRSYLFGMKNLRAELIRHRVAELGEILPKLVSEAQAEIELLPPLIVGMRVNVPYVSVLTGGAPADAMWRGELTAGALPALVEDTQGTRSREVKDG